MGRSNCRRWGEVSVAQHLAQGAAIVDRNVGKRSGAPRGEVVEHDRAVLDPAGSSLGRTQVLEVALEAKELVGETESNEGALVGGGGVKEAPARVRLIRCSG